VKVLVDAQLPQRLAYFLQSKEIDAIHTLQLSKKNATPDRENIESLKSIFKEYSVVEIDEDEINIHH